MKVSNTKRALVLPDELVLEILSYCTQSFFMSILSSKDTKLIEYFAGVGVCALLYISKPCRYRELNIEKCLGPTIVRVWEIVLGYYRKEDYVTVKFNTLPKLGIRYIDDTSDLERHQPCYTDAHGYYRLGDEIRKNYCRNCWKLQCDENGNYILRLTYTK